MIIVRFRGRQSPRPPRRRKISSKGRTMKEFIGAIDQGTTSTRFIVFDHAGEIVAIDQREHAQICPRPGWVEHDAAEIWRNTRAVIEGALEKARLAKSALAAVGVTNQRETTVLWDKATGAPLHNAIVWMDMRTDALVASFALDGGRIGCAARPACRSPPISRAETRLAPRPHPPCARARGARRGAVRHDGQLADLEPDRRRGGRAACHRRHQRLAHAAHESRDARLGGAVAAALRYSPRLPARISSSSEVYARVAARSTAFRSPARSATSMRRCSGRPALRPATSRTPMAPAASC